MERLKYPIGRFVKPKEITEEYKAGWRSLIKKFPSLLVNEVRNLDEEQKNYTYRPDGWNIKQVVHHCADSHMNAFIRFKLSLTEDRPTVKPYLEHLWAELPDGQMDNLDLSLGIIIGVHERWIHLIDHMKKEDFERTYHHPQNDLQYRLDVVMALYAWHGMHHLAHVKQAIQSGGSYSFVDNTK